MILKKNRRHWAQGQRLREVAERKEHDVDGASDVSDEEEIEEELGFISPLDTVNPYVTFKQALTGTCPLLRVCVPVN